MPSRASTVESSFALNPPQCLDRIQFRSRTSGIDSQNHADAKRHQNRDHYRPQRDFRSHAGHPRYQLRHRCPQGSPKPPRRRGSASLEPAKSSSSIDNGTPRLPARLRAAFQYKCSANLRKSTVNIYRRVDVFSAAVFAEALRPATGKNFTEFTIISSAGRKSLRTSSSSVNTNVSRRPSILLT